MAAYKVATTGNERVWWVTYQMPGGLYGARNIRDASSEEAELMEKVIWDRDTPADLIKLKELIRRI